MKKIIFAIFALAALLFTSCNKEIEPSGLGVLSVDKTFVSLPAEGGGEATLTVTVAPAVAETDSVAWHLVTTVIEKDKEKSVIPANLTIAPVKGGEGETVVTLQSAGVKKAVKTQLEFVWERIDRASKEVLESKSQFVVYSQAADPSMVSPYPEFEAGNYWIMFKQADDTWLASKHATCEIDNTGSYGYVSCQPAAGTYPDLSSLAEFVFTFEATEGGFVIKDTENAYIYQDAAGKYNNFYRTSKKAEAMVWTVEQVSDTEFEITSTQGKWIQYSTGYSTWGAYNSTQSAAYLPYLVPASEPAPVVLDIPTLEFEVEKEGTTLVVPATVNADQVSVDYDADWIQYFGTNAEGFVFKIAANEGVKRNVEISIAASLVKGEKEYTGDATVTIKQATGIESLVILEEDFSAGLGSFTLTGENAETIWTAGSYNGSYYMKAKGAANTAAEAWLVSPKMDLTATTTPVLTFEHCGKYFTNQQIEATLWVTNDAGATWTQLLIPDHENNYAWKESGDILLTKMAGKADVQIGFKYITTGGSAYGTWEVAKIKVEDRVISLNSIAEVNNACASTSEVEYTVNLTNAVVTYVNGGNAFIQDATAGTQLYKSGHGLTAGQVINGTVVIKQKLYAGYAEWTDINLTGATVTTGEAPAATVLAPETLSAAYLRWQNCFVKLEGVTLTALDSATRDGSATKGEWTMATRLQDKNQTIVAGTGNLTCLPTRYNAKLQLGIWSADHFVVAE